MTPEKGLKSSGTFEKRRKRALGTKLWLGLGLPDWRL